MELEGQNKQLQDMAKSTVATIADTGAEEFLIQRGIKYITADEIYLKWFGEDLEW